MTSSSDVTAEAEKPEQASSTPRFADIEAAAARLAGQAVRTPVLELPALNDRVGGRVLLKPDPRGRRRRRPCSGSRRSSSCRATLRP